MQRHVWAEGDGEIYVYSENASGQIVDFVSGAPAGEEPDPIFQYCFAQGISIAGGTAITRRAVTGRGRRKIITPAGTYDDVSADVDHWFFRKEMELDLENVFNPHAQLRLVLAFTDIAYSGIAPFENDTISLSFARAQGFRINSRDNQVVEAAAHFEAEMIF